MSESASESAAESAFPAEMPFDTTMPSSETLAGLPSEWSPAPQGQDRPQWPDSLLVDRTPDTGELTRWLNGAPVGAAAPAVERFEPLYDDLRQLVGGHLRRRSAFHLLTPSAISHDAWMHLADTERADWRTRSHFLAVASTMLRRILVSHSVKQRRADQASSRDADCLPVTVAGLEQLAGTVDLDVVAVHDALLAYDQIDPRAGKVVELRFFGGLENHEIAEALGLPLATVKRDWGVARTWLQQAFCDA